MSNLFQQVQTWHNWLFRCLITRSVLCVVASTKSSCPCCFLLSSPFGYSENPGSCPAGLTSSTPGKSSSHWQPQAAPISLALYSVSPNYTNLQFLLWCVFVYTVCRLVSDPVRAACKILDFCLIFTHIEQINSIIQETYTTKQRMYSVLEDILVKTKRYLAQM